MIADLEEEVLETMFEDPEGFYKPEPKPTFTSYVRKRDDVDPKEIKFRLVGNHPLWGHRIWQCALLLSDMIDYKEIDLENKAVMEIGAGAGLPSIISILNNTFHTVITDYNDTDLVSNLSYNVDTNIPSKYKDKVSIIGHTWGKEIEKVLEPIQAKGRDRYDVIIACDVIFNHVCHRDMLQTIDACLSKDGEVIVFFTHHRPHKANEDMNFFKLAEEDFGLTNEKILQKMTIPMFEHDFGSEEVRSTVHYYLLRRKSE